MTDTEINPTPHDSQTPLTDTQLALVGAVVEFAEIKILFIESQQFEKAAVMKRYMDAIQGAATAIAEANARADAAELNFANSRKVELVLAKQYATQRAELEAARADVGRLDKLIAFINVKGADGIRDALWTVVDPDELMEDRMEVVFDRATIDRATKSAPEEGR